jgi:hypothetical protein
MSNLDEYSSPPEPAEPAQLSEEDVRLLTEARTASWRLQQYEFAFDLTVRKLSFYHTLLDFGGVLVAVLFLYLQSVVPDANAKLESVLSYVGSGLSVAIILFSIWGAMAQWKRRIEKMQALSTNCRELVTTYEKLVVARPVDHPKLRKWLLDSMSFEEAKKEPLAVFSSSAMKRGFKHIGNLHMGRSVVCSICNKEWTHESNKKSRWSWVPFKGCEGCGV